MLKGYLRVEPGILEFEETQKIQRDTCGRVTLAHKGSKSSTADILDQAILCYSWLPHAL